MVKIITDTTSCLPMETALRYSIPVIPQVINFGDETFLEGIDLDSAEFMRRLLASPELPKTAAPPPELFIKEFEKLEGCQEPILCIHPSTEVSGTVRSAQIAAADFPDLDIRVIDTRIISSPLAALVTVAAEMAAAGDHAEKIISRIMTMAGCCRIYFLVATLEYLARGGRIGSASALLGSLLQIKPILAFRDGKVHPCEKERTYRNAFSRLKEITRSQVSRTGGAYLSVMHAGVPEQGKQLAEDLKVMLGLKDVSIYDMPPAIVTHGGPGILGVGFFTGPGYPPAASS
jgi:DegV family protein with EDD domain